MRVALLAVLLMFSVLPHAQAQDDARAFLHDEQNTLWAHKDADNYFMSAVKDDPDGTVASAGYNPLGYPLGTPGELTFTFPMRPTLANEVTLDGDATITFYAGGCVGPEGGAALASTELTMDGTVIAEGDGGQLVYAPETGSVTWTVPVTVDAIAPGANLVWTVHLQGVSGQACGKFSGETHSSIVLPVTNPPPVVEALEDAVSGGAATIHENLTTLEVHHNFTAPTNDTFVFNATTSVANGTLEAVVNGTGLVNATLQDGQGAAIFSGPLGNGTVDLTGVKPGNWTLTLAYTQFTGSVDIAFLVDGPAPAAVNATTAAEQQDVPAVDEESPGVGVALFVALFVGLAFRRR